MDGAVSKALSATISFTPSSGLITPFIKDEDSKHP
jgi:hypothetical protein